MYVKLPILKKKRSYFVKIKFLMPNEYFMNHQFLEQINRIHFFCIYTYIHYLDTF